MQLEHKIANQGTKGRSQIIKKKTDQLPSQMLFDFLLVIQSKNEISDIQ
jgi:hypothetical protein